MMSQSDLNNKCKEVLILARGQEFLGKSSRQIKAFLMNRGVSHTLAEEAVADILHQRNKKYLRQILVSIILILGGIVLGIISIASMYILLEQDDSWALIPLLMLPTAALMVFCGIIGLVYRK